MSIERLGCVAKFQRDGTFRCERCNLAWDHGDDDPPACVNRVKDVELIKIRTILKGTK